jgi:hypothetical protein
MIRQIFVQESVQDTSASPQDEIYSLALEVQSEELRLIVKRCDSSTPITYILKEFDPGSDPHMFIQTLLKKPGIKTIIEEIPCFCSIAKLVERTNLKGILANIFIPYRKKGVVVLPAKEVLFSDLSEKNKISIHELLSELKPYE